MPGVYSNESKNGDKGQFGVCLLDMPNWQTFGIYKSHMEKWHGIQHGRDRKTLYNTCVNMCDVKAIEITYPWHLP